MAWLPHTEQRCGGEFEMVLQLTQSTAASSGMLYVSVDCHSIILAIVSLP